MIKCKIYNIEWDVNDFLEEVVDIEIKDLNLPSELTIKLPLAFNEIKKNSLSMYIGNYLNTKFKFSPLLFYFSVEEKLKDVLQHIQKKYND